MEGINIPTKDVMQEVVRSQIQNYVDSEDGKYDIIRKVEGAVSGVFDSNKAYWEDAFQTIIRRKVYEMTEKALENKHVENIGAEIFEIGLKKWFKTRGYEVKKSE